MAWRMIGTPLDTADLPTGVSQRFRHPEKSMILRGVQVGMILYNDPDFSDIEARIYTDNNGVAGKLLAISQNTWAKPVVLTTHDHGVKFAGFSFDYLSLRGGTYYHLVLHPNDYTGDSSSHIGWRISYPDPQYRLNLTVNAAKAAKHHLDFGVIGSLIEVAG
jgi:hypothetical protein